MEQINLEVGVDFRLICSRHPKYSMTIINRKVDLYYHRNRIELIVKPCPLCEKEIKEG